MFARLWFGMSVSGIGAWLTTTAVSLLIFDITGSTLAVGLVAGISLLPMVIAGIWGGMLADAFDRRAVALVTASLSWLSIIALVLLAGWDAWLQSGVSDAGGRVWVWPFYLVTTVNAVATTITSAARAAAVPRILPESLISRANALNGLAMGMQVAVGPALAGVLVATVGFPATFLIDAVLFTAGFAGVLGLPKLPPEHAVARPGLDSLRDGIEFLRGAPNLRLSFLLDIVAMSFGRPQVMFPAIGVSVIGGGAVTVGILTASMAIGTLLASLFSGPVARVHRHGLAVSRAIQAFGLCTVLLGVVIAGSMLGWFGAVGARFDEVSWPALILATIALAGTGAADEVSAIFRQSMLQTAAPDQMRGRLQGVFMVVVTGGPRVGEMIAGVVATFVGLWAPALLGGVLVILLVRLLVHASPSFAAYDERRPTP